MENTKNKTRLKAKGLRMPYEKPWAQGIILAIAIFCLLFSFLPLFLTVVNSFKLDDQVKVDDFRGNKNQLHQGMVGAFALFL